MSIALETLPAERSAAVPPSVGRWLAPAGLLAALAVALFFRTHDLGAEGFDCDEIYAVRIQGTSPRTVATVMARDSLRTNHPALMTVPYLFWTALVGTDEAAVRTLPLLLGLLAVGLTWLLGTRLGGPVAGFFAAAVVALNPLHVAYSQEARHYAMLVVLIVAAHLLLLRCLRGGTVRDRALYFVVCLAALYTHYFAVPALSAHGILALWLVYRGNAAARRNAVQTALTLGLAIVLFVPWLAVMKHQATRPWGHLRTGTLANIVYCLQDVVGLAHGALALLPAAAAIGTVALGLAVGRRRELPATATEARAPVPRWIGGGLALGGVIVGIALFVVAPSLLLPAARATLVVYEPDPAVIDAELGLIRTLLLTLPLALAVVGGLCLAWGPLVRLGERLPQARSPRPVTVSLFVGMLLLAPLVFLQLVGLLGVPFVQPVNLLVLVPPFSVAVGLGLAALMRSWPGRVAAAAGAACLAVGILHYEPIAAPFGGDGIRLGTHTSTAWRDLAARLDADLPLVAVKTWQTDPALYYLAANEPRRIQQAADALTPGFPARFRFLHVEDAPPSAQALAEWERSGASLQLTYRRDGLAIFEVRPGQGQTLAQRRRPTGP